jgi:hypothetical protein
VCAGDDKTIKLNKRKVAMKTKDLLTIGSVALGTATLTVLTLWSDSLEAGNERPELAATISKPKLVSNGVEMTLAAAEGRIFKAGDEPVFQLEAINTTGAPATVDIWVAMTASSPTDALSRVVRLPSVLWQEQPSLVLQPHETKVISLPARTKLPANTLISVSLQQSDQLRKTAAAAHPDVQPQLQRVVSVQSGIIALSFSTANPAAQPVPAS